MTSADTSSQRTVLRRARHLARAMMAAAAFGLPALVPAAAAEQEPLAPAREQRAATPAQAPARPAGHDAPPAAAQAAPVEQPAQAAAGDAHAPQPAHATPAQAAPGHAQPEHAPAPHGEAQAGHGEGEHGGGHEESPLAFASRILNFVILAGGLYYFLRKPLADYLAGRGQQIRGDLLTAKETTATAGAQLAEIDRKLQALPSEIAALKDRGKQEIVNEEARIRETAATERQRLIEQTRREIDLQVRLAKRQLTEHAATLAVDLAGRQIEQTITPDDQARLIDRYATQVRNVAHE